MPSQTKPSIVFAHGLWADGSCYAKVIPTLQADGHEVVAVQNSLDTLKGDVDAVIRAFGRVRSPGSCSLAHPPSSCRGAVVVVQSAEHGGRYDRGGERARRAFIITGATGTGKSYVACALAQQACRTGYRATYRRMPRLLEELALAHADGTYTRLLGRLAKIDVLVLDDWGLAPLREQERRDLLEIFDDRHGARSTIVTSQLPVET
jgi:hypothetical protein